MVDKADEIGLDYTTDTFDYGQHLNVDGAEKTAVYLGNILKTNTGLLITEARVKLHYSGTQLYRITTASRQKNRKHGITA